MNRNKWIVNAALVTLLGTAGSTLGQADTSAKPHPTSAKPTYNQTTSGLHATLIPLTPAQLATWKEINRLAADAAAALDAGEYAEAESDARQSIAIGPDAGVAQEVLASALNAQGKSQEALEVYQQMADSGDTFPRNLLPYALLSLKAGRWAQAVTAYNKQLLYLADGKLTRASSHFSPDVLQPKELEAAIHIALGLTYGSVYSWGRHSQVDRATSEYKKALALEPDSPLANLYYGRVLQRLGRKAEAQAAFAKAAKTGNEYVEADAEEEMNWPFHSKEQILTRFQQAVAQDPNSSLANRYYGDALARLGRPEAQAFLTKAAKIENEEGKAAEEAEQEEIRQRQPR